MRQQFKIGNMRLSWRHWRRLLWAAPVLAVAALALWLVLPVAPMPEALAALASDDRVIVERGRWLVFRPAGEAQPAGLIFYPGARVDYRAYAPAMRALAEAGYRAVIVPMPLQLAVLAPEAAADVIAAMPDITTWAIGGHSLGGTMAAHFAYDHPGAVRGVMLWAAYPTATEDLSARPLAVISIFGTRDGLSTPAAIEASRPLLPPTTQWVPIAGGNHAQFGWYGPQAGDTLATITRAEQQQQIIAATLQWLQDHLTP